MTGILKSLQSARPGTDFVANEKYLKYFQVFKNCTAREHFPPAWLIDLFSGSGVLLVKGSPSLVKVRLEVRSEAVCGGAALRKRPRLRAENHEAQRDATSLSSSCWVVRLDDSDETWLTGSERCQTG